MTTENKSILEKALVDATNQALSRAQNESATRMQPLLKGMNLPGVQVSTPAFTDKDRADARFALGLGVDFIALSFVRQAAEVSVEKSPGYLSPLLPLPANNRQGPHKGQYRLKLWPYPVRKSS